MPTSNNCVAVHHNGTHEYVSKRDAYYLLRTGHYYLSRQEKPFTVSHVDHSPNYDDELSQATGYLVNKSDEPSEAQLKQLIRQTSGRHATRALCQKHRRALDARRSARCTWKGRKGAGVYRTKKPRRAHDPIEEPR